jgi:hypothetical protein
MNDIEKAYDHNVSVSSIIAVVAVIAGISAIEFLQRQVFRWRLSAGLRAIRNNNAGRTTLSA